MRKGTITNGSGAAVCAFVIFANAYSVLPGTVAGQDAWIVHLVAGMATILISWLIMMVCEKFPEQNFYEILLSACGKCGARLFSAVTLLFTIVTCVLSLTVFSRFVQLTSLFRTPQIVLPLIIAVISAFAIRSDLRAVSGAARLLFWFFAAVFAVFVLFGIRWMEFSRLIPSREGIVSLFSGAGEVFLNRFGMTFALFSVYTRMESGPQRKSFFMWSVAGTAAALALVGAVTVATLGKELSTTDFYPVFTAMSVRGVGGFIQHTELLACIAMTLSLFFKTSVCLLFSEDMLCGIFDVTKKSGFALPLGLICSAMTQLVYRNLSELRGMVEWTSGAWWVIVAYAVLPLVLFACAKGKKRK